MPSKMVTYEQLHRLLLGLQFECVPARQSWKAYRHTPSDTLIVLAGRPPSQAARGPDLFSVRRHLADKGILDEAEFDRFLTAAS